MVYICIVTVINVLHSRDMKMQHIEFEILKERLSLLQPYTT